jgi:hypothetical protein
MVGKPIRRVCQEIIMENGSVIRLYTSDYYIGIGQPYLLLAGFNFDRFLFVESYYFLIKQTGKLIAKSKTYKADVSSIFPNVEAFIQKDILLQSSYAVFYDFILPEIGDKEYRVCSHPEFEELDKIYLCSLKKITPGLLERIREVSQDPNLKNDITMILSINVETISEQEM